MTSKVKRGSFGQLKGVEQEALLRVLDILNPAIKKHGLTQTSFLTLVAKKVEHSDGSLDFLSCDTFTPYQPKTVEPKQLSNFTSNPILEEDYSHNIPSAKPAPFNVSDDKLVFLINKVIEPMTHHIAKLESVITSNRNDISELQNAVKYIDSQLKQTSPKRNLGSTYNLSIAHDTDVLNLPINELFKERFNGASIPDYHAVLKDGRGKNSNSVFIPSSDIPKPTYVMQEFISAYNVEFRNIVGKYIQNANFVSILSIDDNKLLNYIRQRYQAIGDMETYITLCDTQLFNLTLPEIENLLMNLTPYQFVIRKPAALTSSKTGEVEKYPIGSPESRFKSAFLKDFDVCWTNDITEFETI